MKIEKFFDADENDSEERNCKEDTRDRQVQLI